MTTTREILIALRQDIIDGVNLPNGEFNEANVIITAQRVFLPWTAGKIYCEVHPLTLVYPHGTGGVTWGLHEIATTLFANLELDQPGRDTQRLTEDSLGLLQAVDAINNRLLFRRINADFVQPPKPIRMEAPTSGDTQNAEGWAAISMIWEVGYEVTYG